MGSVSVEWVPSPPSYGRDRTAPIPPPSVQLLLPPSGDGSSA